MISASITIGDFAEEIFRVIDAFKGQTNTPRSIAEFITLNQRLRLLFHNYPNVPNYDADVVPEKLLVEATMRCLTCFVMHFETEVLNEVFATEPQSNDFDTVVHPAYQSLERVFATAVEQAKLFQNKTLEYQIHQCAMLVFGFVPTLDPRDRKGGHVGFTSTSDFLSFVESSHEDSDDSGSLNGNVSSSSISGKVHSPFIASFSHDTHYSAMNEATTSTLSAPTPRRLSDLMDVEDIISGGLGLFGGHRGKVHEAKDNSKLIVSGDAPAQTEQGESLPAVRDGPEQSSSLTVTDPKPQVEKKRETRARAAKKSTPRRQRTISTRSNPNKENIHGA